VALLRDSHAKGVPGEIAEGFNLPKLLKIHRILLEAERVSTGRVKLFKGIGCYARKRNGEEKYCKLTKGKK